MLMMMVMRADSKRLARVWGAEFVGCVFCDVERKRSCRCGDAVNGDGVGFSCVVPSLFVIVVEDFCLNGGVQNSC